MGFDPFNDEDEYSFREVENLLDADFSHLNGELESLYKDIEYFVDVADALDSAGRESDADYFRDLAVDRYRSFADVIQMKKLSEDELNEGF